MASHSKEYMAKWRNNNREICRNYQRKYRRNNLEKCRASNRAYQSRHPNRRDKWVEQNRDKVLGYQRICYIRKPEQWTAQSLKRNYGITLQQRNDMFDQQSGLCAICRDRSVGRRLQVDHDHKTGKVRKLLCPSCNNALGMVDDRPDLLKAMIAYLEEHA